MTTKPRVKKFRIRRGGGVSGLVQGLRAGAGTAAGSTASTPAQSSQSAPAAEAYRDEAARRLPDEQLGSLSADAEIEAIRAENLTGRQLRMARRVAQKHGLSPESDLDAVRILRHRGIDPFERENLLELVVADAGQQEAGRLPARIGPTQVPAPMGRAPGPPAPQDPSASRAREVLHIQRDIARRRRRRLVLLAVRLAFFVFLPTLLAGYYYFKVATPMYATKAEFLIQQADSGASGQMGGLFSGTAFATTQDSITVQSYLQSREAMLRLNDEQGFKAHFQRADIDPIQRLEPDATNEAAYRLFRRHVRIGFDPTEGIVKMEVIAASPIDSAEFSRALIRYAEEQVDQLTQRLREDQMRGARQSFEEAELKVLAAQSRVLELQEQRGVLSAELEVSSRMGQINTMEVELNTRRLELEELLENPRPNQARVDVLERTIARLERRVGEMRSEMIMGSEGTASLARISGELVIAEADLQTRQMMLSQALQQLETARIEANRQVRFLSLGVSPVAPDEATYPRAIENTVLAFLIFAGIYLMISLTASILREQVSA
ncbi:MAG: capsule biosynthesis protein [Rhodobacteraceae bacterium]|nr:capsule biosynthesis protein [Paracoccaceae bacterium]